MTNISTERQVIEDIEQLLKPHVPIDVMPNVVAELWKLSVVSRAAMLNYLNKKADTNGQ